MKESVAVIIPCRNEEKYIGKCIESFINQTYPKELLEIVIADGRSDDKTRTIIKDYMDKYENVKLVDNEKLTAPSGMNKAINETKTDIVIIFGAHAEADKDFVLENVKALENKTVGCAGGTIKTISDSIKGEAIAQAMMCPFGVGNALFRYAKEECYVDTVGFGAYRRSVLEEIGIFDEELVRDQDDELNFRVTKSGKKILLSPRIKGVYYSRSSIRKLWKQYYQYGFWKIRVMQKHKKPASIRHLVPLTFVVGIILGGLLSVIFTPVAWIYVITLGLYFILDIIFSVKMSRNYKSFKYLLLIFPTLHLAYGLGTLMGIYNFYISNNSRMVEANKEISR